MTSAFVCAPVLHVSRSSQKSSVTRRCSVVRAEYLTTEGLRVDFLRPQAAGNFGRVYFGRYVAPYDIEVVIKCPTEMELARSLYRMELYTNEKLARSKQTPARYARYLGQIVLPREAESAKGVARVGLVWQREGDATLETYLNSARVGKLAMALGRDAMGTPVRRSLCAGVLRELLLILRDLQTQDIVHRDLKPANVLVVPEDGEAPFRAIDFGSACEWSMLFKRGLGNATCDEVYAPPEQTLQLLRPADRFDVYSVALIALRVALPSLTDEHRMRDFVDNILARCRYNLLRVVSLLNGANISASHELRADFAALDSPKNEDLLSVLASMLAERPEDRADVNSALQCAFLVCELGTTVM